MIKFHFYLFAAFLLLVLTITYLSLIKTDRKQHYLLVNNHKINLEIASTKKTQQQGLSGRDYLPENNGMLFVYNQSGYRSFWMKEMKFPLDFVWINDGQIIGITVNVQPKDYQPPKSLTSPQPVDKILEINANEAEKLGLKVGQQIALSFR